MTGTGAGPEGGPEKQGLCSFEEGDTGKDVLFLMKHFYLVFTVRIPFVDFCTFQNVTRSHIHSVYEHSYFLIRVVYIQYHRF